MPFANYPPEEFMEFPEVVALFDTLLKDMREAMAGNHRIFVCAAYWYVYFFLFGF